ncbi:MAG: oligosaccharide flippase family protein [Hyphomonadaceae bacterium]|nr:oligosaccharide flippase family protein [Clostridia bacterium]
MNKKRLMINMIAGFVAFGVNMGISFILSPYIIKTVGIEAYGFVGLVNNFVMYASLLTIALNSMAGRFITIKIHEHDFEGANKYFYSVLIANSFMAIVLLLTSTFVVLFIHKLVNIPSDILTDIQILFAFSIINFIVSIFVSTFSVATFVKNKLYLNSLRNIESQIIRSVLLFSLFMFFKPRVFYIGLSALVVTIYLAVFHVYYTKKLLPEIKLSKKYFDFGAIKELVSSGIWNTLSQLSSILSTGLDLLIANLFVGAVAMGTLSIAKTLPILILSVFGMMAGIFSPQLTESYAKGDIREIKKQLITSIKLLGMLTSIPMSILFIFGDSFYALWVPSQNAMTLQSLSMVCCASLVFALPIEGLWNVFTVTNKIKTSSLFILVNSVLTIAVVIISMRFASSPMHRIFIIAGVSTIFGLFRSLVFLPLYGAKCLDFKWHTFYPYIIKNTLAIIILCILSFTLKQFLNVNSWIILIFVCVITALMGFVLNYFIILAKEDRLTLLSIIQRKLKLTKGDLSNE